MRIAWRPAALADLGRLIDLIEAENPAAAVGLLLRLRNAARSLATLPQRGRHGHVAGTRELVVLQNYVIVYDITDDAVTILRIWHSRQERR